MTKVVNRFAISMGAIFLILCGFCPKIGAIMSVMPQSVLGGAAVMMFASILISGIQLITKEPIDVYKRQVFVRPLTVSRGIFWNMWKTEMMKTMKTKDLNQIMSVLYLGLGYGFVYLWSSWTSEWSLTLFTAAYAIAVLGYCYGSGRKPARESWRCV